MLSLLPWLLSAFAFVFVFAFAVFAFAFAFAAFACAAFAIAFALFAFALVVFASAAFCSLVFSCFCVACVSFCFYIYFTVVSAWLRLVSCWPLSLLVLFFLSKVFVSSIKEAPVPLNTRHQKFFEGQQKY